MAQKMEQAALELARRTRGADNEEAGEVRIATTDSLALEFVIPALRQVHETHPEVRVVLSGSSEIVNLSQRETDIAIRNQRPDSPDLGSFAGHDLVVYEPYWRDRAEPTLVDVPMGEGRVVMAANASMMLRRGIAEGLGLGEIPVELGQRDGLRRVWPQRTRSQPYESACNGQRAERVCDEGFEGLGLDDLDREMPETLGQPDDAGSGRRLQVLASQWLAVLVLGLDAIGRQLVIGLLDVRRGVAVAVDHPFAVGIEQVLEVARQRLDQHETLLADPGDRIVDVQAAAFPDQRAGNVGAQHLCVIATGGVQIGDQYIHVAELEVHRIARSCRRFRAVPARRRSPSLLRAGRPRPPVSTGRPWKSDGFNRATGTEPVAPDKEVIMQWTPQSATCLKALLFGCLAAAASPIFAEQICALPDSVEPAPARPCFSGNRFEWVVHGLWPQNGYARSNQDHPRNCQTVGSLPAPLRPSLQEMLGSEAGPNQLVDAKVSDIKQAFLAHNPALPAQSLRVSVGSGNRLKELWVCLDTQLGPTPCPTGGTPDNQQIKYSLEIPCFGYARAQNGCVDNKSSSVSLKASPSERESSQTTWSYNDEPTRKPEPASSRSCHLPSLAWRGRHRPRRAEWLAGR
ncbi:hypothetical protein WR25_03573 [Diploscapter pachys]|uniref:LysR substrate-binding domain-containing protein n=1 Tax=Diploscapter pachys TaxID=2018661 RepID=A0A2A2KBR1_9BILA|nr:hypothetical protein WR25_03573 [Diploscapter pachys]